MGLFTTGNEVIQSASELTAGVSESGMDTYKESLKLSLLTEVEAKLDDVGPIQTAVDAGWQGYARDKFFEDFDKAIEDIKQDLRTEYKHLFYKLGVLENNYFIQDRDMMNL